MPVDTPPWNMDIGALLAEAQRMEDGPPGGTSFRLAMISDFTSHYLARVLRVMLHRLGVRASIYEVSYGGIEEAILTDSDLYRFAPQLILLLPTHHGIRSWPAPSWPPDRVEALAQAEAGRWTQYRRHIRQRLHAQLIQGNYNLPPARSIGNHEAEVPFGGVSFVRLVNRLLAQDLSPGEGLFDLEYLTSYFGLREALEDKIHHLTKQPFSFSFLPFLAHCMASTVAAHAGKGRKCLVLDLDDTLWGGVVGDDGVFNLNLGPTNAVGEAFVAFQRYLKALKERGVLLAVCSKNDDPVAREVFERHPEMVLRLDDIASFVANWEDKASNLALIARQLNIGLDSLVFFDDNPRERHIIRQVHPEVAVVDVPEDPAEYVRALDEGRFFEISEITQEDAVRTTFFHQEQKRTQEESGFVDYGSYLDSLTLSAKIAAVSEKNLRRVAELVKRTNQFNLRTMRHSQEEIRHLVEGDRGSGFCVSLRDRFGDYGLISVVLLRHRSNEVFIDTWLMSCRALKKTVEAFVLAHLIQGAAERGFTRIIGEYRPTAKNRMVADLYPRMGFRRQAEEPGGAVLYALDLHGEFPTIAHHITHEEGQDGD